MSQNTQILTEGDLTFSFPDDCDVQKYDDWPVYKNRLQGAFGSLKAVDFICYQNKEAWFIEIKDYRSHDRQKTMDLIEEISWKIRDTVVGLVAISQTAPDQADKKFAKKILSAKKMHIIFHLEEKISQRRLATPGRDRQIKLKKLKGFVSSIDAQPKIVNKENIGANIPWSVK